LIINPARSTDFFNWTGMLVSAAEYITDHGDLAQSQQSAVCMRSTHQTEGPERPTFQPEKNAA
jgi:hypothetical protein